MKILRTLFSAALLLLVADNFQLPPNPPRRARDLCYIHL